MAGLVAGLLVFVMLFTVGTGYFIYQATLQNQYDQANGGYCTISGGQTVCNPGVQQKAQAANSEQLTLTTGLSGSNLIATASNTGGVPLVIAGVFVIDQSNNLLCFSPQRGSTPVGACPGYSAASIGVDIGRSTVVTTGQTVSCSPSTSPCTLGVLTQRGREFTQLYPMPAATSLPPAGTVVSILTQLFPSNSISVGQTIFDTATLLGTTTNAGGNVKYYLFNNGMCSGSLPPVQSQVTLTTSSNGPIVPDSNPQRFSTTGSYSWEAVYSGDPNNLGATSPCEPLTVTNSGASSSCSGVACFQAAQGFGSLSFDFNSFRLYTLSSCTANQGVYPPGTCNLELVGQAYTILADQNSGFCHVYCVFSVDLINVDPQQRSVTMNYNSYVQSAILCGSGGIFGTGCGSAGGQSSFWSLGCVSNSQVIGVGSAGCPSAGVTLGYGRKQTFYFVEQLTQDPPDTGGSKWNQNFLHTTPVFMLLQGTYSTGLLFGQNIPFTTILWSSTYTEPSYIFISPSVGPANGPYTIRVTGGSFTANTGIKVFFDGTLETSSTTDASGSFQGVSFTVASASAGQHTVCVVYSTATNCNTPVATATFAAGASPFIIISPDSGPTSTTVQVLGDGFIPASSITITFNDVTQATIPSPCVVASDGSFVCSFIVPSLSAGVYVISATDSNSNTASSQFTHT